MNKCSQRRFEVVEERTKTKKQETHSSSSVKKRERRPRYTSKHTQRETKGGAQKRCPVTAIPSIISDVCSKKETEGGETKTEAA